MHISSTALPPHRKLTESELVPKNNAHPPAPVSQRNKRSIDAGPSDQNSVSDDPKADKNIGTGQKVTVPVDVGPNPSVDPATAEINDSFKTVSQEASIFLKKKFAEMAAKAQSPADKEKWGGCRS